MATADPPEGLEGAALAKWTVYATEVVRLRYLTVLDVNRLARGCLYEAQGDAKFAAGEYGKAIELHKEADKCLTPYGIGDPRERARLRAGEADDDRDSFEAFRKEKLRAV